MDLGTMENGGDSEDDDGGQDRDSSLDGTERRKGLPPVWTMETRQRIASRRRQCVTTVGQWRRVAGSCPEKKKNEKESKKREKERETTRGEKAR